MTTFGPENPIDVPLDALSPLSREGSAAARAIVTAYLEAKRGDPSLLSGELSRLSDRIFGGLTIESAQREVMPDLVERLSWVGALVASLAQLVVLGLESAEAVALQLEEVPEDLRSQLRSDLMGPGRMLSVLFLIADEQGLTF